MARLMQIAIAADQLANATLGGWADETFSARCWRCRDKQPYRFLRAAIDALPFFGAGHCERSYQSEVLRLQSPPAERG